MSLPWVTAHALKRAAQRWRSGSDQLTVVLALYVVQTGECRVASSGALKYKAPAPGGERYLEVTVKGGAVVTVGTKALPKEVNE